MQWELSRAKEREMNRPITPQASEKKQKKE